MTRVITGYSSVGYEHGHEIARNFWKYGDYQVIYEVAYFGGDCEISEHKSC